MDVASERMLDPTLRNLPRAPVRPRRGVLAGRRDREQVPRGQLVDALVDRIRRGDISETEEEDEAAAIERAGEFWKRVKGLELGAEQKRIVGPAIVEGLDAQAIANERERLLLGIPQGEAEHPVQATEGPFDAPRGARLQENLGVRVADEMLSFPFQVPANVEKVVDLAVVGDHIAAAMRGHGLVAGGGEIQDRQPAAGERNARRLICPHSAVVGSAMPEGTVHGRAPPAHDVQ